MRIMALSSFLLLIHLRPVRWRKEKGGGTHDLLIQQGNAAAATSAQHSALRQGSAPSGGCHPMHSHALRSSPKDQCPDNSNDDQQACHLEGKQEAVEERQPERLDIAMLRDHLAQVAVSEHTGAGAGEDQVAQGAGEHQSQDAAHHTLPRDAVSQANVALLRRQQRDHEEEEHHERPGIDQNLHDSNDHGLQLQVEHRQEEQREDQAQSAVHGILEGDNAYRGGDAGDGQHEKRDLERGHSFLLSSSCSSSTSRTGRSVGKVPRPTAAALAGEPSKTCVSWGTGCGASSGGGGGSAHTSFEPLVAWPFGSSSCSL